jgi:O-antigen ligase
MNKSVKISAYKICENYTLAILCLLAFCVSLGTATVSISKALILFGVIGKISLDEKRELIFSVIRNDTLFKWILFAIIWMLISMLWSIGSMQEQWKYLYGHSRIIWIAVIYYLLDTRERTIIVLKWLVYGQILVVIISWLLWIGVEIPFTQISQDKGVAFASRIEQPVMTTLVLIVIWNFREYFRNKWGKYTLQIIISIMLLNLLVVTTGRTGYLVFLGAFSIEIYRKLPINWRWASLFSPIFLAAILFTASTTFHDRTLEIKNNAEYYFKNGSNLETSEGQRLDMWKNSLSAIKKAPILGYGVGSMKNVYKNEGGLIEGGVSQPHQQYLFWWVEFGLIGLLIMLSFFYILAIKSKELELEAKSALISVSFVLFLMGLANCPFFGVGMGEFFFLLIAALLKLKRNLKNDEVAVIR